MSAFYQNPFPQDADRRQIWEMLVERDIIAFCRQDWSMVADDFIAEGFMGIDARKKVNPDSWRLQFPDLGSYRTLWLEQATGFGSTEWAEDPERAIYEATTLGDIRIQGNAAVAYKKFDGQILKKDGTRELLRWQTLYRCRKVNDTWKIAGFTGYLPNPMSSPDSPAVSAGKQLPASASQHTTAGPYSPVLEVQPGKLVVISGQAALNQAGQVVGTTIEGQTKKTLENCRQQLATAGCTLDDVFKVNVYLTDLDNWPRFNRVYETYFQAPRPVRTAVQTPLLMTLLVEVEMWAVRKS